MQNAKIFKWIGRKNNAERNHVQYGCQIQQHDFRLLGQALFSKSGNVGRFWQMTNRQGWRTVMKDEHCLYVLNII